MTQTCRSDGLKPAANLTAADLEMFARLKIPSQLLAEAGVIRVTDAQARSVYGIRGGGDMAGIAYPYFAPATMTNGRQRWYLRIRRDHPEIEGGKEVRCAVRRPQAPLLPTPA